MAMSQAEREEVIDTWFPGMPEERKRANLAGSVESCEIDRDHGGETGGHLEDQGP